MLLPDFLVFLGPKISVLNPKDEGLQDRLRILSQTPLPFNSCIILAEHGVLIRNDALKGTLEIIRCAYDLLCLIPDSLDLKYLNENDYHLNLKSKLEQHSYLNLCPACFSFFNEEPE